MTSRNHAKTRRRVRSGLNALAKSVLLIAAVPAAIARLWFVSPIGQPLRPAMATAPAFGLHVLLVGLGVVWLWAAAQLVRDIVGAFAGTTSTASRWSARWAAAIASLVIASSAGSVASAALPRSPAASVVAVRPAPQGSAATTPSERVAPGECLSDVAARVLGGADLWPALARANLDRLLPDGSRFVDPNLLRPGWCLVASRDPAAPPTPPALSSRSSRPQIEVGLLGLGILASAALVRRLRMLRRLNESTRAPGARPPSRRPSTGALEALLAPLGEATLLDWIETANRLLSALGSSRTGEVVLVRAGPGAIEFLFAEPNSRPPHPFSASPDGRWWILSLDGELADRRALAGDSPRHRAALVPIGDDGEAVYLLALGPGRRLVLDGEKEAVDRALAGLLSALRVLPWAEQLEIALLGIEPPPVAEQSYQFEATTVAALRALGREVAPAAMGRRREALVVTGRPNEEERGALDAASSAVGVICCGGTGSARLEVDRGRGHLSPFGLDLCVSAPDRAQQRLLELLLAEASLPANTVPLEGVTAAGGVDPPPAGSIEVRLLDGPPRLVGLPEAPAPRDSMRLTELVAYLALHGGSTSVEELQIGLFGRARLLGAPSRLDVLLAAARRCLGIDSCGRRRLVVQDGRARLAPDVTSDWTRLIETARRARQASPERARQLLVGAVELLGGGGIHPDAIYDWQVAEGLFDLFVAEVVDASHHLASLALAADDLALAWRAIEAGRVVEPASEILGRDLLVCCAAGAPGEVARGYEELEVALGALAGNEPSAETRALFARLAAEQRALTTEDR